MSAIEPVIVDADGILLSVRIELVETSGPVSPAFQYRTHIVLYTENNVICYEYDDDRQFQNGKPQQSIHALNQLKQSQFMKILQLIYKMDSFQQGTDVDFIGDVRNKIGISFNYMTVCIGADIKFRVDYLLSSYDNAAFKSYQRVIEQIKSLAH
jgi:hypothetical protein